MKGMFGVYTVERWCDHVKVADVSQLLMNYNYMIKAVMMREAHSLASYRAPSLSHI